MIDKSDLSELLNELVSSSLSSGGFVLAALAIIASIKQTVPALADGEIASSGQQFLYNSRAFHDVIRMYGLACSIFLFLFVYFSLLRSIFDSICNQMFAIQAIALGVSLMFVTFVRSLYILWFMVRIK